MVSFITAFIQWAPLGLPKGLVSIIIVSAILSFLLTWVYKLTINYPKYKELTDRQKALNKEIRETKDPARMQEIQNEVMKLSMQSFKMSLKPMIITFIPVIIIFALLRNWYFDAGIGNIFFWKTNLPIVHDGGGWFFCYVVFSFIFSLVARKILKF
jgi:uncharacterized membrane protein (DUF106 family)